MFTLKIGSLCSTLNHPYTFNNSNVKISGLAQMTPPIMVIIEILNPDFKFDSESGELKKQQVKCAFYSHKSNKYESLWFMSDQLKLISSQPLEEGTDDPKISENDNALRNSGIAYLKDFNLKELKLDYINKRVIFKSCDIELGKKKITFEEQQGKERIRTSAHLDFVSPVMTVLDVKLNDEKIKYDGKTGYQKKITSNFLVKCKWFNPHSNAFSEDFLPIESIEIVESQTEILEKLNINEKILIKHPHSITLRSSNLKVDFTFIQPLELVFKHYKYVLKYKDLLRSSYDEVELNRIGVEEFYEPKYIENFVTRKTPRYNKTDSKFEIPEEFAFVIGEFYRITYRDAQENVTIRIIYVTDFEIGKVLIADCLFRNGEQRHFKPTKENLLKVEELNQDFFQVSEQENKSEMPNVDADEI